MPKNNRKLPLELQKLSPYFHDIDLGDGLNTAPEIWRLRPALNSFFPPLLKIFGGSFDGLKVIDVGCNCGGFSFAAVAHGAKEVLGIDADDLNIKQANALKKFLKYENITFKKTLFNKIDKNLGKFDLAILAGIMYHLQDPIGAMSKIVELQPSVIFIDSHVHFSSNANEEDMPSWWMLPDTDQGDLDGLFVNDQVLNKKKYLEFEKNNLVNYNYLPNNYFGSPHSQRDLAFIKNETPHPDNKTILKYAIRSSGTHDVSLVPNKKALIKLLRYFGYEDILEIVPQRFSNEPYMLKHRIALIATKRTVNGAFPISEFHKLRID